MKIKNFFQLLALLLTNVAYSQQADTNFQVNSTLNPTCEISGSNFNLGQFTPATTGMNVITNPISFKCSKGIGYEIKMTSSSGSYGLFEMSGSNPSNNDKLAYYAFIFKNGSTYNYIYTSVGNGNEELIDFRVRTSRNQYVQPDTYLDNITITITY